MNPAIASTIEPMQPPPEEIPDRDEELVRRAAGGDAHAFGTLVTRYHRVAFSVAVAHVRNGEVAEELAQEVFLRAFLRLESLREPHLFAPWIARIARNLAVDWIKSHRRQSNLIPLIPLDESLAQLPDRDQRSPRDLASQREEYAAVEQALGALAPAQRELLFLHFAEELPKAEIARMLGVHPTSVGRQLDQVLSKLRHALSTIPPRPLQLPDAPLRAAVRPLQADCSAADRTTRAILGAAALSAADRLALAARVQDTPLALASKAFGLSSLVPAGAAKAVLAAGGAALIAVAAAGIALQYTGTHRSTAPVAGAKPPAPARATVSAPVTPPRVLSSGAPGIQPVALSRDNTALTTVAVERSSKAPSVGPTHPAGNAVIEGRARLEPTGEPVAGVFVAALPITVLSGDDRVPFISVVGRARETSADEAGRFRFDGLTSGSYSLVAEKHPLISSAELLIVTLGDGETTSGIDLAMRPGWVRTGTVYLEGTSQPLALIQAHFAP